MQRIIDSYVNQLMEKNDPRNNCIKLLNYYANYNSLVCHYEQYIRLSAAVVNKVITQSMFTSNNKKFFAVQ